MERKDNWSMAGEVVAYYPYETSRNDWQDDTDPTDNDMTDSP